MQLIVITLPSFIPNEGTYINRLFEWGIDRIHIRKPGSSLSDCRRLVEDVSAEWHARLSLHDHHSLSLEYGMGIHLNARHPEPPLAVPSSLPLSASCHSFSEVVLRKPQCRYVFLSPVFDSISKQGYCSSFSSSELQAASCDGIIDRQVMALGGITASRIPLLREWNFGGAVMLGDIWNRAGVPDFSAYIRHLVMVK